MPRTSERIRYTRTPELCQVPPLNLKPQPSILTPKPQTPNPNTQIRDYDPRPPTQGIYTSAKGAEILTPEPQIPNPNRQTPNPKPQTRDNETRTLTQGIYTSVKGAVYKGEYDDGERHGSDPPEREFCVDNLLACIHFVIEMICRTGLVSWKFEIPFPGSHTLPKNKRYVPRALWQGRVQRGIRRRRAARVRPPSAAVERISLTSDSDGQILACLSGKGP